MRKVVAKTLILCTLFALLFAGVTAFVLPAQVASADTTKKVIAAPVSNLEGNEYAGKSYIGVYVKDDLSDEMFYIPESYFLENPVAIPRSTLYTVEYANTTFYIESKFVSTEDVSYVTDVTFRDNEAITYPQLPLSLKRTVTVDDVTVTNDTHLISFLGYSEDSTRIYVRAESLDSTPVYGFIAADDIESFNVPYQAKAQRERDELIALKQIPTPEPGDIVPNTSVALRVIIILGIAIPGVLIVLLLFKPSSESKAKRTSDRYRSDFDYDNPRTYRRRDDD